MRSRDRRFYSALMLSLILHGGFLFFLHQVRPEGDNAGYEREYYRPAAALVLSTSVVPVPVSSSEGAADQDEAFVETQAAQTTQGDRLSETTGEVPETSSSRGFLESSPPIPAGEETLAPEFPEQNSGTSVKISESGGTGTLPPPVRTTSPAPALPGDGAAPETYPSPVHLNASLQNELERQLQLYIERYRRYPDTARRRGLAGEVELYLTMRTGRRVELSEAVLVRSAGSVLLDREARRLVESFFPYRSEALQKDAGSELSTTVRISYRLR